MTESSEVVQRFLHIPETIGEIGEEYIVKLPLQLQLLNIIDLKMQFRVFLPGDFNVLGSKINSDTVSGMHGVKQITAAATYFKYLFTLRYDKGKETFE